MREPLGSQFNQRCSMQPNISQPFVVPPNSGRVLRLIGVVHLPKTIPHALYNPLKTPLRILALAIPGGMEMFFDEMESAVQDGSMDDAKHREISRKYGIE